MSLPALAFTVFYFMSHAYLLCKQDRFVLLVFVLLSFMLETVWLDEYLKVLGLSPGTGSLWPSPLNNVFICSLPTLLLLMGPPPEPVTTPCTPALSPVPATQPAAALEGSMPPVPKPRPLHILCQSPIEHVGKTDFMPGIRSSSLIGSRHSYFTFNLFCKWLCKTYSARHWDKPFINTSS